MGERLPALLVQLKRAAADKGNGTMTLCRGDNLAIQEALARLAAVETERDALRAAIREYIDMEPPATASPYWHKPDGGLRAALDSEKNSNSLSQQDSCWSVIDDA